MSSNGKHDADAFSPDYTTARERFRAEACARGFGHEAFPVGGIDPDGADLTIDAAIWGSSRSRHAVVVSSGLHGVEGYLGSAVQLAFLRQGFGEPALPDNVAVVLLHALDPFGFAWGRRFDEENVDLNRNFLVNGDVYRGSPSRYSQLDDLLNPKHAPSSFDPFWPRRPLGGLPVRNEALETGGGRGPVRLPARAVLRRPFALAGPAYPRREPSSLALGRRPK